MAKAYIKEMERLQDGPAFPVPVWNEPAFVEQTPVDYSAGAAQSAAFSPSTNFIAMTVDETASFLVGPDPVATTDDFRITADTILVIGVRPGHKISFVSNT